MPEAAAESPDIAVETQSIRTGRHEIATPSDWPGDRWPANENRPAAPGKRRSLFTQLRGLLAAGFVTAALMATVAQREAVVRMVPSTAGAFAAIGLPVSVGGLQVRAIKSTLLDDGPRHVLAVVGEIANTRAVAQGVPMVRVALRGVDGREIYNWTAPPPKPKLQAGETVAFRARLADPPSGARDVSVQFADAAGAPGGASRGR